MVEKRNENRYKKNNSFMIKVVGNYKKKLIARENYKKAVEANK